MIKLLDFPEIKHLICQRTSHNYVAQTIKFVAEREEKMEGNGENACY